MSPAIAQDVFVDQSVLDSLGSGPAVPGALPAGDYQTVTIYGYPHVEGGAGSSGVTYGSVYNPYGNQPARLLRYPPESYPESTLLISVVNGVTTAMAYTPAVPAAVSVPIPAATAPSATAMTGLDLPEVPPAPTPSSTTSTSSSATASLPEIPPAAPAVPEAPAVPSTEQMAADEAAEVELAADAAAAEAEAQAAAAEAEAAAASATAAEAEAAAMEVAQAEAEAEAAAAELAAVEEAAALETAEAEAAAIAAAEAAEVEAAEIAAAEAAEVEAAANAAAEAEEEMAAEEEMTADEDVAAEEEIEEAVAEETETQEAALTPVAMPEGQVRVLFGSESADLPAEAEGPLRELAARMAGDEAMRLELLAYAAGDEDQSSRARRMSLSRALAVRAFLINEGVRSTRMDVRALGNNVEAEPADRVDILPKTQ